MRWTDEKFSYNFMYLALLLKCPFRSYMHMVFVEVSRLNCYSFSIILLPAVSHEIKSF